MNRSILVMLVLFLSGCGDGFYTPVTSSDGQILIVNRYTGNVQRIDRGALIPVPEGRAAFSAPTLPAASIVKVPIIINGRARYAGEKMLVRVNVAPAAGTTSTPADWQKWRQYILGARYQGSYSSATLTLQFTDALGFVLAQRDVELREFRSIVNHEGEMIELEQQFELLITPSVYRDVTSWSVGWNNWPEWTPTSKAET